MCIDDGTGAFCNADIGFTIGAGDLFVGNNATITGSLHIGSASMLIDSSGNASTTGFLNVGTTLNDLLLDSGDIKLDNLFFNATTSISQTDDSMGFQDGVVGFVTLATLAAGGGGGCGAADTLLSGGIVTWTGTGLVFDISPSTYCISGVQYEILTATQVTLDAADADLDRFDVIVTNTSQTTTFVKGTAAADPAVPSVASTELKLTVVLVSAGASEPGDPGGPFIELIYDEDTEWVSSQDGGNTGVIDFANATDPQTGSVATEVTTPMRNGDFFKYASSTDDLAISGITDPIFSFQIKNISQPDRRNGLTMQWLDSGDGTLGSAVTFKHGQFGYDRTNIATYQKIAIPFSNFGATGDTINKLQFTVANFKQTTFEFRLDDIRIEGTTAGSGGPGGGFAHGDLADMPSSANADHDGRYGCKLFNCGVITNLSSWLFTNSGGDGNVSVDIKPTTTPASALPMLRVQDSAGNTDFVVMSDGNVGIGTSTPTQALVVNGTAHFGGGFSASTRSIVSAKTNSRGQLYLRDLATGFTTGQARTDGTYITSEDGVFKVSGQSDSGSGTGAYFTVNHSTAAGQTTMATPLTVTGANLTVGVVDATLGKIILHGTATGEGGEINLHLPGDQDGTFASWNIDVPGSNQLRFFSSDAVSLNIFDPAENIFNQQQNDIDFRVESNTLDDMIFGDAGTSRVGINTKTPGTTFEVNGATTIIGDIISEGTAPSVTAGPGCGISPSITGTDTAGTITVGSGTVLSCTVTFNTAYANAPVCVTAIENEANGTGVDSISTTALKIDCFVNCAGQDIQYICIGL